MRSLRRLVLLMATGGIMLQTTTCTQEANVVTAVATTVTAGGVLFLIDRVLED